MRFGFHISIAGGFSQVVERAQRKKCETIQFFSRNPRGWKYSPLNLEEVEKFKLDLKNSELEPIFVHLPYLPNLSSPDDALYERSVLTLCEDLKRAETLGASYLITHLGRGKKGSLSEAIERMAVGINKAFSEISNSVMLLLENTAGGGTEIGFRFEHIGLLIDQIEEKGRIGVCLDTAHTFEAGYDLSNAEGLERTLREFDHFIGLKRLYLLHLNDSKTPLGSRIDRHWHIGEGYIGREGFRQIVNHPQLSHLPGIMETPRMDDREDLRNLKTIKSLISSKNKR